LENKYINFFLYCLEQSSKIIFIFAAISGRVLTDFCFAGKLEKLEVLKNC
jgi:hypothetical protein